jgi:adenosylhomocysteinase
MKYHIKDVGLAKKGMLRVEWANQSMPVLNMVKERFQREKPLKGLRFAACLHVTTETASLMETLKAGGAQLALCASNPLSTQDDHINAALDSKPHLTMDDGADLVSTVHAKRTQLIKDLIGGTEETTTGVIRLRDMAQKKVLRFPVISVNDAYTKHLFDNRYGTGQSTIDGITRATNRLIAGSTFVVCGYGWCGRGLAMRAKGMGANVIVIEVDHLKALEATMDGFRVMPLVEASKIGDFFCTVTGDIHVIDKKHFLAMKNGAIVSNSGHFNVELNLDALAKVTKKRRTIREFVEEHTLKNGKKIYVLAEGRLINLAAAEGHPSSVMDMSFANQALAAEHLLKKGKRLEKKVYPVPAAIDEMIAKLKLKSMGITIDTLTKEQKEYLSSWEAGT